MELLRRHSLVSLVSALHCCRLGSLLMILDSLREREREREGQACNQDYSSSAVPVPPHWLGVPIRWVCSVRV